MSSSTKIRLNLGSGNCYLSGYINVDLYAKKVDVRDDIETLGKLKEFKGKVDEIYSSHSLMCIPEGRMLDVLRTWRKMLKKGGKLIVETTDLDEQVSEYRADVRNSELVVRSLFGDGVQDGKGLRYQFNFYLLYTWLSRAGFKNIKKIGLPQVSEHNPDFCFAVEAININGTG